MFTRLSCFFGAHGDWYRCTEEGSPIEYCCDCYKHRLNPKAARKLRLKALLDRPD